MIDMKLPEATGAKRSDMDAELAETIGLEGYAYLYPLVLMDITRRQLTNVETVSFSPLRAPANVFLHVPVFPPADFRAVVRPNFDTLYSMAFLDLREEPQIVSVPAAEDNYYLLPFYDMWGEVFACPGTRTTGDEAGDFAIVGPSWAGELPAGARRYNSPTSWAWIIGRTEASVATYDKVHAFQSGLKTTPLSAWGGEPPQVTGTIDPSVDDAEPLRQVFAMDAATFFGYASELLQEHAPHPQDYPVLDRLARIGFNVGNTFDLAAADDVVKAALTRAVPTGQKQIADTLTRLGSNVNGWQMMTANIGNYGTNYLARACVELLGLGANLADDAIYPLVRTDADGKAFTGDHRYVWHLEPDELPPVNAFWSLTLYDNEGFQVANELNRFAIGDRDDLASNNGSGLDIFIQHTEPEQGTSNWLPAPTGEFTLCARLYYPKREVLDGTWAPPPVKRIA
jgi:hypothetical protein